MNKIITDTQEIEDSDAIDFYNFLSDFTGQKLNPEKDQILLTKPPPKSSRNSDEYMVYCEVNKDRKIAFKRCFDMPDFIRREISTSQAQKKVGFSSYKVVKRDGILLRDKSNKKTCKIFSGWEKKTFLIIDCGNPNMMKELKQIKRNEIDMIEFFKKYGKWAAFNCLIGVQDRHAGNFVISLTDETVYSVDNEEGPFDSNGNQIDVRIIANQIVFGVSRFLIGDSEEPIYKQNFKQGFIDGWNQIAANLSSLDMFYKNEKDLIRNSIIYDDEKAFNALFPNW